MKKNIYIRRYRFHLSSFQHYFEKLSRQIDKEDLHQFRVSIKKIRIILKLIQFNTSGHFSRNWYKLLFKELFKKAGELREVHLNKELAIFYRLNDLEYWNSLNNKEQNAKNELNQYIREFHHEFLEEAGDDIKRFATKLNPRDFQKNAKLRLRKKFKTIQRLISSESSDEILHEIRRQLKSISEIVNFLIEIKDSKELVLFDEVLGPLHTSIGQWHDKSVLIESYKTFHKNDQKLESFDYLFLVRLISNESLLLNKEILNMIHQIEQKPSFIK